MEITTANSSQQQVHYLQHEPLYRSWYTSSSSPDIASNFWAICSLINLATCSYTTHTPQYSQSRWIKQSFATKSEKTIHYSHSVQSFGRAAAEVTSWSSRPSLCQVSRLYTSPAPRDNSLTYINITIQATKHALQYRHKINTKLTLESVRNEFFIHSFRLSRRLFRYL